MDSSIGIVVIGRNEGERLRTSLASVHASGCTTVYVDSGSTDGSAAVARSMGVEVVELDRSQPYTAARSRNAGFERLQSLCPGLTFVQFIDGDCEMSAGWLRRAEAFLREHPRAAVAWGRRWERFPEKSIYNRLCNIEWNTPVGEITWCGGDTLMRASALIEVGGFNPSLIAGEEPELCVRLREKHWTVHRIAADVTVHDANLIYFSQWWRRTVRTGYAFAEGAHLHRSKPGRYCVREVQGGVVWGMILPLLAILLAWPTRGISVAIAMMLYALQFARIVGRMNHSDLQHRSVAIGHGTLTVLGKLPQAIGQIQYWVSRARGQRATLIEYKPAPAAKASAS
jgi:glycosyltransferase involved in cell wall biosynthesis